MNPASDLRARCGLVVLQRSMSTELHLEPVV
jgi:hypothetical protein